MVSCDEPSAGSTAHHRSDSEVSPLTPSSCTRKPDRPTPFERLTRRPYPRGVTDVLTDESKLSAVLYPMRATPLKSAVGGTVPVAQSMQGVPHELKLAGVIVAPGLANVYAYPAQQPDLPGDST